jgi:hypothetical protein
MRLIQVFEPPMCCSTDVCGPEVDPILVQFAADLDALGSSEVKVERFNLSQSPARSSGCDGSAAVASRRRRVCPVGPALVRRGSGRRGNLLRLIGSEETAERTP